VCGAVQACDFPVGLADLFDLERHVLPYNYLDGDDLCAVVDRALSDPRRLEETRIESFWHVLKNYRFGDVFRKNLEEVL
jgi:hypothetical protein